MNLLYGISGVGEDAGLFWVAVDGLATTPLFQINLLPDLMHVYLVFETILVSPDFVHLVPANEAE